MKKKLFKRAAGIMSAVAKRVKAIFKSTKSLSALKLGGMIINGSLTAYWIWDAWHELFGDNAGAPRTADFMQAINIVSDKDLLVLLSVASDEDADTAALAQLAAATGSRMSAIEEVDDLRAFAYVSAAAYITEGHHLLNPAYTADEIKSKLKELSDLDEADIDHAQDAKVSKEAKAKAIAEIRENADAWAQMLKDSDDAEGELNPLIGILSFGIYVLEGFEAVAGEDYEDESPMSWRLKNDLPGRTNNLEVPDLL